MRVRLAHLSDPHLPIPRRPSLPELASKRMFGYANWVRNRQRALVGGILETILADIAVNAPDHICLTGDLVNVATEAEFVAAAAFLARLGVPNRVSVVLGNHDAYVPGAAARATRAFAPWIGNGAGRFPNVRRLGPVALFGVSTAVATPPLIASGTVGAAQRDALAALLDRHDDAVKVVMIHHPPDRTLAHGRRGLTDVDAVRDVLSAGCVDLVLHGHTHEPSLTRLATARGEAAIVGVPSASSDGTAHAPAGYALIDIDEWRLRITRRTLGPNGTVRTSEVVELTAPRALRALTTSVLAGSDD